MQMHSLIDAARWAGLPADHPGTPILTDLVAQLNHHAITPYQFAHRLVTDPRLQEPLRLRWTHAEQRRHLAAALHCALLESSLRSLSGSPAPELLAGLVTVGTPEGRWSIEEALAYVRRTPDPRWQGRSLAALLECGQPVPLDQATEIAYAITDAESRCMALAAIIPHVPPERQGALFDAALSAAREIGNSGHQDLALIALIHYLPPNWLRQLFATGRERLNLPRDMTIDVRWWFVARGLPLRDGLKEPFFDVARAITAAWLPIAAPDRRAPHLIDCWPYPWRNYSLAAARDLRDEWRRSAELDALASLVPLDMLNKALAHAQAIKPPMLRAYALAMLTVFLPERRRADALAEALQAGAMCEGWHREQLIADLVPDLPAAMRADAPQQIRSSPYEHLRIRFFCQIAPDLPALLPEALGLAQASPFRVNRVEQASMLAAHFPADRQAAIYAAALAESRGIDDTWQIVAMLDALAARLPETLLPRALASARSLTHPKARAQALAALLPYLPADQRDAIAVESLALVDSIDSTEVRADIVANLAPHLPHEALPQAMVAARAIVDPWYRVQALLALAPRLPEDQRAAAYADALAAAYADELFGGRTLRRTWSHINALTALAPHLPAGQQGQVYLDAFRALCASDDPQANEDDLAIILAALPDDVMPQALEAASRPNTEVIEGYFLSRLAPRLPAELLPRAFATLRALDNRRRYIGVLLELAPRLPDDLLPEVLELFRSVPRHVRRVKMMLALAPRLPEERRAEVYAEAIDDLRANIEGLAAEVSGRPADPPDDSLDAALERSERYEHMLEVARTQAELALTLLPELREQALAMARAIEQHQGHIEKRLPGLREQALATARAIEEHQERAQALATLLPHLPADQATVVGAEALAAADAIDEALQRGALLHTLLPDLPDALLPAALVIACNIREDSFDPSLLAKLGSRLEQSIVTADDIAALLPSWHNAVRTLAEHTRGHFLMGLAALTPLSARLTSPEDLAEIVEVTAEVARCWP